MKPITIMLLASAVRTATAIGYPIVTNRCSFSIFTQLQTPDGSGSVNELKPGDTETFDNYPDNAVGGNTIRFSLISDYSDDEVETLDYSKDSSGTLWWSLGDIDGHNMGYSRQVEPSDRSCTRVECAASGLCPEAYNYANDDQEAHACSDEANLEYTACP